MTQMTLVEPAMRMSAQLSDCGKFRWSLERWWGAGKRHVVFVMCNPSIANHEKNDPTIKACIHFARLWGYDGLKVVNLFPFCSPYPVDCRNWYLNWDKRGAWDVRDAMQANEAIAIKTAKFADLVVAAWGNIAWDDGVSDLMVSGITSELEPWPDIYCLGTTQDGSPKHPLARGKHRIPRDQQPVLWRTA